MANDLLFIACTECHEVMRIHTYYPYGVTTSLEPTALSDFIEGHLAQHDWYEPELPESMFALRTEATLAPEERALIPWLADRPAENTSDPQRPWTDAQRPWRHSPHEEH